MKVLMAASVASMILQFNLGNLALLKELGYEVHVACNFKEGNTCSARQVRELIQFLNKREIFWHQWDCPRSIRPLKNCVKAYRQIFGLLQKYPFAWMHCHSPIGGALARIAAHRAGVAVIYTAHGFHFYQGAPLANWLFYYPAEKLLSRWTDVLITVNREDECLAKRQFRRKKICLAKRQFRRKKICLAKRHFRMRKVCLTKRGLPALKIWRIPGVGVDTEKFFREKHAAVMQARAEGGSGTSGSHQEFCRMYQIPEHALVLLSVGELNKGKNHRIVIGALAALSDRDVYYLICGQGALRDQLQQYADSLGVGERIRMPGFVEDLSWIYGNADIFVFPSVREGMPVALMEAMAGGLPCVVSDIRGCRELLAGGNSALRGPKQPCRVPGGFRFSLKQPGQLLQALKMLVDHETLRQVCGACNQCKIKNYDQRIVQKKMKEIYTKMGLSENSNANRDRKAANGSETGRNDTDRKQE